MRIQMHQVAVFSGAMWTVREEAKVPLQRRIQFESSPAESAGVCESAHSGWS